MSHSYDTRRLSSSVPTICGVESRGRLGNTASVLDTNDLLSRLKLVGARNIDIARVLGLPDSRIPEIYSGKRQLKLDEAVKLVRAFNLDDRGSDEKLNPLSAPIARLLVLHLVRELRVDPPVEQVNDLAEDLRAFSQLALDQTVRDSAQAVDGFFRGIRLRRRSDEASPQAMQSQKVR